MKKLAVDAPRTLSPLFEQCTEMRGRGIKIALRERTTASAQFGRYTVREMNLDALYREHAPAITASLARSSGARRLDLIETAVQEAFVSAIESWRTNVPARPGAWLQVAARRRVIDALRRATWIAPSEALDQLEASVAVPDPDEDLLKMMFVCCHPAIPLESALALALRTLSGFPVSALSRALRLDEAAVEKRLIRARQVLREGRACAKRRARRAR